MADQPERTADSPMHCRHCGLVIVRQHFGSSSERWVHSIGGDHFCHGVTAADPSPVDEGERG